MAQITAALVKELRDRTGLGMMECKKALSETSGDMDQAIDLLRKSSGVKAAKKAGRTAAEGIVSVAANGDGSMAVVLEVNCETDFVARDAGFVEFVSKVVDKAVSDQSATAQSLAQEFDEQLKGLIQKIGENITIRRLERVLAQTGGAVFSYVHNDKIAVAVALQGAGNDLGRDIAMHIAASNPVAIAPEDVSAEDLAKEREIYTAQAQASGKPAEIIDKMVEGRVRKYLAEVSLTEQPFVKTPDDKVGDLLKTAGAQVTGFVRFEVGEGIEKQETDFAEEVRQQAGI